MLLTENIAGWKMQISTPFPMQTYDVRHLCNFCDFFLLFLCIVLQHSLYKYLEMYKNIILDHLVQGQSFNIKGRNWKWGFFISAIFIVLFTHGQMIYVKTSMILVNVLCLTITSVWLVYFLHNLMLGSQDSLVGIVTCCGLGGLRMESSWG